MFHDHASLFKLRVSCVHVKLLDVLRECDVVCALAMLLSTLSCFFFSLSSAFLELMGFKRRQSDPTLILGMIKSLP